MVEAFMIADTWFMVWHEKLILLLKRKVHMADVISTRCTKAAVAAPNNAALWNKKFVKQEYSLVPLIVSVSK